MTEQFQGITEDAGGKPPKPDLHVLLKKWTSILKLQDWDLRIKWARHWELDAGTEAHVRISLNNKSAAIRIMTPDDYEVTEFWGNQDAESTLVHELLHLHLEYFGKLEGLAYAMREQVIESLARGFLELDRSRETTTGREL